jgi:hypothetical protein
VLRGGSGGRGAGKVQHVVVCVVGIVCVLWGWGGGGVDSGYEGQVWVGCFVRYLDRLFDESIRIYSDNK